MAKTDEIATPSASRGHQFAQLQKAGLTYSEIAERCQTTRNAVAGAIRRATKPEACEAYKRAYVEAREYPSRIEKRKQRLAQRKILVSAGKAMNRRDRRILQLFADGVSLYAIAAEVGISHEGVRQRIIICCGWRAYAACSARARKNPLVRDAA